MGSEKPFWQAKRLDEMSQQEWESLCDGCARCCLVKLEDADTGEIHYTNVACKLLDTTTCRCTDYPGRKQRVSACFVLTAATIGDYPYLPETCAYRRLAEGKDLPDWHPLITGDAESVRLAGISVRDKVISEEYVHQDELEQHIVDWPSHV